MNEENLNSNSNSDLNGIIMYDKLVDSQVMSNIVTNSKYTEDIKSKSSTILFDIENVTNDTDCNFIRSKIVTNVNHNDLFNINYKLKCGVNQINEFIKKLNE